MTGPSRTRSRGWWGALVLALALTLTGPAGAVAPLTRAPPPIEVVDGWDRKRDLRAHLGSPIVLVYEDKDSSRLNQPFKNELARLLSANEGLRRRVAMFPIADVDGYDYWPARGFVKKAIREESVSQRTTIYCDWTGRVRAALGLQKNTSNVVLFGRDGGVRFAHAGVMSEEQRRRFLDLLRAEAAP